MPEIDFEKRDDRHAKEAWVEHLCEQGYVGVEIRKFPADVTGFQLFDDGAQQWWWDVKKTDNPESMFGSATFTELGQAMKDPEHFRFVVAHENKQTGKWEFCEWTLDELLPHCTIPPFKVNFTVNMWQNCFPVAKRRNKGNGIPATRRILEHLMKVYDQLPRRQPSLDI